MSSAQWSFWLVAAGLLSLLNGCVILLLCRRLRVTTAALAESREVAARQARDRRRQTQALDREIAECRRADAALRQREAQFFSLIHNALQGVLIHIDHVIQFSNPAAARLFGYEQACDLIGRDYRRWIAPHEHERLDICIQAHLQGEAVPLYVQCQGTKRDGVLIWCEFLISRMTWEGHLAVMMICLDITARKQAELAWRDAKHAAEAARRAQQKFLANMSHELRTPLHAILSYAGFGLKKLGLVPPEKLHQYFSQIDWSGRSLLAQLNELLDFAKLEAGKMTFTFESVNLNTLLLGVADEFRALSAEREVAIDVLTPDTPTIICLDATRIVQVMRNLVSNAVKFSPCQSAIIIRLECRERTAVVSVCDQGPGIPEGEREAIFDRFVQSRATATSAGGTGLGLAICYEIITAHGGGVWADNQPDGGAVFAFALPFANPTIPVHVLGRDAPSASHRL